MTTKLHELARSGDLAGLEAELRNSGVHDQLDEEGQTPLMVAVSSPQAGVEAVRCLIEHGADVQGVSGPPASLTETIAALRSAGIDATDLERQQREFSGDSVLSIAVKVSPLAKIRLLLEHGADASWANTKGYGPVLNTLFRRVETTEDERLEILGCLLDGGASPNVASQYGESPLSVASQRADSRLLRCLLDRGADPAVLHWNDLFEAIAFDDATRFTAALAGGAPLEAVDAWGRTPFLCAVQFGRLSMAQTLLEQGAARDAVGRAGLTALHYAIMGNQVEVLRWLLAADVAARGADSLNASPLRHAVQFDHPECARLLIASGADIHEESHGFGLMYEARSPETALVLLDAGLALDGLPGEQRPRLCRTPAAGQFAVRREDYASFHTRRFGRANPEEQGNSFWNELVRARCSAYEARQRYGDEVDEPTYGEPTWCCLRFGQSLTRLPSGEFVEIGGEHEDFYDPDFCIYNDVIVHDGRGGFRILGYPEGVFPPTDFHSATWLDGAIFIIGSLGDPEARRVGETPVYRLDVSTWRIAAVATRGPSPGWIHKHRARAEPAGTILIEGGQIWDGADLVDNRRVFRFDPSSGHWSAL